MKERIDGLAEITLAIARAAADADAAFREALENELRNALLRNAADASVFHEAFLWLSRFENGSDERTLQKTI